MEKIIRCDKREPPFPGEQNSAEHMLELIDSPEMIRMWLSMEHGEMNVAGSKVKRKPKPDNPGCSPPESLDLQGGG